MKESGIVIFPDGKVQKYGTYYCPDEKEYLEAPSHEKYFQEEIMNSFSFKLTGFHYDKTTSLYENALRLSLEGLLFIFNNQKKKEGPTEILAYVPVNPTLEQLNALKNEEFLKKIEIMDITEFQSLDWTDYIEYDSFQPYIDDKKSLLNQDKII